MKRTNFLVSQVNSRPPATNENLDDDALLDGLGDDFMYRTNQSSPRSQPSPLLSPPSPTAEARATPMEMSEGVDRQTTVGELLTLRKDYKKVSVQLLKAESHLEFATVCKQKRATPKGLTINVKCSAHLADLTDVKDKFRDTTKAAQNSFVNHL